jgi:hypothetical protein
MQLAAGSLPDGLDLDSRDLLEIAHRSGPDSYLVPATSACRVRNQIVTREMPKHEYATIAISSRAE